MGLLADYIMHRVRRSDELQDFTKRTEQLQKLFGASAQAQPPPNTQFQPNTGPLGRAIWDKAQGQHQGQGLISPPGATQGGTAQSGLLSGGMARAPGVTQSQAIGLLQIPGMEGVGSQLLQSQLAQNAAMERQRQQQGFDLSQRPQAQAYELEQIQARAQAQAQAAMARQRAQNMFDLANDPKYTGQLTRKDLISAENTLRDDYTKEIQPYYDSLERYNSSINMVNKRGGTDKLSTTDSIKLVRDFIKSTTPKEAIMSDDQRAVAAANTFGGTLSDWKSVLTGKNSLGKDQVERILATMKGTASESEQAMQDSNQWWGGNAARSGADAANIIRPVPALGTIKGRENWITERPDDLRPVNSFRGGVVPPRGAKRRGGGAQNKLPPGLPADAVRVR